MGWVRRLCLVDKYKFSFCTAHHFCFFFSFFWREKQHPSHCGVVGHHRWKAHGENAQARYNWGVELHLGLTQEFLDEIQQPRSAWTNCMNINVSSVILYIYICICKKTPKYSGCFMRNYPDLVPSRCFSQAEGIIPKNSLRKVLHGSWFCICCSAPNTDFLCWAAASVWCSTAFARIWLFPVLLNTLILTGSSY